MTTNMNNHKQPIICGTDFSIHAAEAANVAAAIAKRVNGEVVLIHVIPPWELPGPLGSRPLLVVRPPKP